MGSLMLDEGPFFGARWKYVYGSGWPMPPNFNGKLWEGNLDGKIEWDTMGHGVCSGLLRSIPLFLFWRLVSAIYRSWTARSLGAWICAAANSLNTLGLESLLLSHPSLVCVFFFLCPSSRRMCVFFLAGWMEYLPHAKVLMVVKPIKFDTC